ncbi:MAG: mycothiol synthase [Actinobacteria bacterium 13_2_20CM_2_71_6]|nr:MAG: mycothiol synthase [Actinobacteria bacterium 13_2_20CM_2_71_6]
MTTTAPVQRLSHLTPDEVTEVLELARAAGDADGAYPLSEHVVLHVRRGGDEPAIHLYVRENGQLVGYAHVDTTDLIEGASAELVVHPMFRRHGLGRALVVAATAAAAEHDPAGRLRLWAHGDHPSASALALSLGFRRARVLYQMRRSLYAPLENPVLPPEVTLRAFRPGEDDERWVALNARAFADLPDQGRWTLKDLRVRMAEPWFDPAGFLLAERHDELVGFHWTKAHGNAGHDHDPIGEVYVLGVDPSAHGLGLGRALTLAGLRYLRNRGLDQAMLYVDEANERAIALYQKLGFARWSTDVSYQRG